jgi:two-component system, LytTR family, response regulator
MTLNCIITDDEPIALEILENFIVQVPGLHLAGKCKDAMETFALMRSVNPDVLFMDIQMPGLNGINYIRSLRNAPAIVLTTAFPEFAIDGYELDITDYLLKPFSFERFLKAVDKVITKVAPKDAPMLQPDASALTTCLFVKSNNEHVHVNFSDILYLQAMENYVQIHLEKKVITALTTMKSIELKLPTKKFLRIHKSYIVNLEKVDSIKNYVFKIGQKEIDTGNFYRKQVHSFIKSNY